MEITTTQLLTALYSVRGVKRNRDASLSPATPLRGTGTDNGAGARHGSAGRGAIADNGAPPPAVIRLGQARCTVPRSTAGRDHSASR